MSGFLTRNLKLMVQFCKEYANDEIVQLRVAQIENEKVPPVVAQNEQTSSFLKIPWTHNIILIQKVKDKTLRSEYQLTEVLPKEFESSLPTIEMIELELKNALEK